VIRSIAAEFGKVGTTRAWWVIAIILVLYTGALAGGLIFVTLGLAEIPSEESATFAPLAYSMPSSIGYVFPLLLGALIVTTEYRNKTLTPTFLATPSRASVLVGKFATGLGMGAVYGLLGLIAAVGAGAGLISVYGGDTLLGDADTWAMLGRILLAMALWGAIGVAFGVLLPSQIGAIVVVLAFTQFVEPTLRIAGSLVDGLDQVVRYLPGAASDSLVGASVFTAMGTVGGAEPLEWWGGALVLAGYAVVFAAIGGISTWRRDVT
jgi:ABC-2 type transport system permease protein